QPFKHHTLFLSLLNQPGVALFKVSPKKEADQPISLFASGHIDWYRSGASYLLGGHEADGDAKGSWARVNGAAQYNPKTDGTRNDVYERFIFTVSPQFEETLPTIPNPKSPYKDVAGKGVWRAHGATTRDGDKKYWRQVWRNGMRHCIITDHEVCWRDGGESFTFRTKPAPKKGGDEGWFDYARFMQDELGFVYGPYNNFTDFSPVNEYWSPDMVNRFADGSLQHAWARCYAPKPTRAVEYCEKLTPINEEKFHFSCAYCDVHSSVPPWTRTDYDARVPGAGTFMSVFYPYGEIFLLQKKNWDGPTYSEGPHHCFYAGLTDGNYGQDQPYNLYVNPWLVDFDLLKMHDLECDFGLGNLGMFAPGYSPATPEAQKELLDRFLCGTLAFGHPGFLALDYGIPSGAKSYFMVQQIASRYTQTSVKKIGYFDAEGRLLSTSDALKADVVKNNQIYVEYEDGTFVVANGSKTTPLVSIPDANVGGSGLFALPPNGYFARSGDGQVVVESMISTDSRERYDYCQSPEYVYLDGRGVWTEAELACGAGAGVLRTINDDEYELILYDGTSPLDFGVALPGVVSAVALNYENEEIGPAKIRHSRGFTFVEPVEGAFSYKLITDKSAKPKGTVSQGFNVFAGEKVDGCVVPDVPAGTHVWLENGIDYLVVPAVDVKYNFDPSVDTIYGSYSTRLATVNLAIPDGDGVRNIKLRKGLTPVKQARQLKAPAKEGEDVFTLPIAVGKDAELTTTFTFDVALRFRPVPGFDFGSRYGGVSDSLKRSTAMQRRGAEPLPISNESGAMAVWQTEIPCGGVSKPAYFLHPPYLNGPTGRVYLRFDFKVPDFPAAIRADLGKRDGSDISDGIKYQIAVTKFDDKGAIVEEKTLAELVHAEHSWKPIEADLSEYAGQEISLLIIADAG
ncbi:MAG: hypothetical protein HUK22_00660, partial [Thermoguttaceae bacterium]|nr:hypothetical protein [Thermoguttaceae bacterium]